MNFGEFIICGKAYRTKKRELGRLDAGVHTFAYREEEQDWRVPTRSKASAFLVGGLRMLERYVSVR